MAAGNRRRYDEIVSFIAGILFGTALPQFGKLVEELVKLGVSYSYACSGAVVFLGVYFRNIHGLIAYDTWAEARDDYNPPFESTHRAIGGNFLFTLLAVLLSPHIFISAVTEGLPVLSRSLALFGSLLFAPLVVYVFWDLYWFVRLRPSKRASDRELLSYTKDWLYQDLILCMVVIGGAIIFKVLGLELTASLIVGVFVVAGTLVLSWDYSTHARYYFAVPQVRRAPGRFYEYGEIWQRVLDGGLAFCHWGGEAASTRLLEEAQGAATGDVLCLEVCCGRGGTYALLCGRFRKTVGVDISLASLVDARSRTAAGWLICADVNALPFMDGRFGLEVMQDGDAWFGGRLDQVVRELGRVAAPDGTLIIQAYVKDAAVEDRLAAETQKRLRQLGYDPAVPPSSQELCERLIASGFRVDRIENVHDMYNASAGDMLGRFRRGGLGLYWRFRWDEIQNIREWLEWAVFLFKNRFWSGVILKAKRDADTERGTRIASVLTGQT